MTGADRIFRKIWGWEFLPVRLQILPEKGRALAFCRPVCYDKQNNDSFWEDGSDHENVIPLVRQRR